MACTKIKLGEGILYICRGGWQVALKIPLDPPRVGDQTPGMLEGHGERCALQFGKPCDCGQH